MSTNNEINVIRNILTESANKQSLNESLKSKALSWAIPAIAGGLYKGIKSAGNEYDKFMAPAPAPAEPEKSYWQTAKDAVNTVLHPVDTTTNVAKNTAKKIIDPIANIASDALEGAGLGLAARAAITRPGKAAILGAADMAAAGLAKGAEKLPAASRIAGRTTAVVGQELGKGIKAATPVVKQGLDAAGKLTGKAATKTTELISQGAEQVAKGAKQAGGVISQGARQAGSAISDAGQAVRSGGISLKPKGVSNIRLTPGSLAKGLAGGAGGLVAGAVTSPLVRKGLEAAGVENETTKDIADTIISGGVGSGVGALIAGGSVAGAAAAGAGVPAAAIAGWQTGRQIGNRVGAGDASKTGAYEQTKEKGVWDLAKGAVGMDDESVRQRELEAEGKRAEARQKEFFAARNQAKTYSQTPSDNKETQRDVKNATDIGGIQTGLRDFYTKPR